MVARIRLAAVAFLAFALMPIVLFGRDGPWYGGGDRPRLERRAPFPRDLAADTLRRVGDWLKDRIGMRYPLLLLGTRWHTALWGYRVRNGVLIGRDGWLFFADDETRPAALMADLRGRLRLPEAEVAAIDRHLAAVRGALAPCGRTAFVLVAPNKQSIYPEQLQTRPDYPVTRLDGLIEKLGPQARAMLIDPRPELRAAKRTEAYPLYYTTDTHWNALGSLLAYQAVVDALARADAIASPGLAARARFELAAEPFAFGDLAANLLFMPGAFPDTMLHLREKSQVALTAAERAAGYLVLTNPAGSRRLLIQGDSFMPPLASLLARHFAETHMVMRTDSTDVLDGDLIARVKPDIVLLELVERHLPKLRLAPHNLARMCE